MDALHVKQALAERVKQAAESRRLTIDELLEDLLGPVAPQRHVPPTVEELAAFDHDMDELSESPPGTACLPPDFSRQDIYADHD